MRFVRVWLAHKDTAAHLRLSRVQALRLELIIRAFVTPSSTLDPSKLLVVAGRLFQVANRSIAITSSEQELNFLRTFNNCSCFGYFGNAVFY